jgi:methylenetetrahydrofolate reductase (NADPH)
MTDAAPAGVDDTLKRSIVDFARRASAEITPFDEDLVPKLAARLLPRTTVYVAHTPRAALEDVVRVATLVESAGLRASPHIVARRIESARSLREACAQLADAGVAQALVVAGDDEQPNGPYASTMELLESGTLIEAGIRRIGIAGHPEGHPRIGQVALWGSLAQKQSFARNSAVSMHIVTQFAFDPAAVCLWDRHLPEHGIELPVYVGMAGPAPLQKLIKYAMQCGVGASLRGLMRNMTALRNVTGLATSPDEMMTGIVTHRAPGSRIVGPHLYSLGGALATAGWLRAVVDGEFTMDPDTGRFELAL